ncbi:MAG: EAL domain-containing protein [Pseudomonas sp.]|nr:EAL domain-containing protein [Pseudomonas sp.]
MKMTARGRFILFISAGYLLIALAWIFLSDQLLAVFTDQQSVVWLSTAKGVFFVITTTLLLFFALRAVPPLNPAGKETLLDALAIGVTPGRLPRWLIYLFAVLVTLAMLVLRQQIALGFGAHLLLILFMLPITLSALLGGFGPGLLSTLIAAFGLDYLAVAPLSSFRIENSRDALLLAFLIITGVAVSLLTELLRHSLVKQEFNRRLLSAVVSGTSDAVFVKDTQGRYLLINEAAAKFAGRSASDIVGQDDSFLFPAAIAQEVMARDQAIMASGQTQAVEEQVRTFDGQERVFLAIKGPVFDGQGRVNGLFGISRDITQRKQADIALRASEAALQEAQHLNAVGNWEWNIQTDELHWSDEIYRIYDRDISLPPAAYPAVQQYFTASSWQQLAAAVQHAIDTGQGYECDAEVLRADGSRRWITARGQSVVDATGQVLKLYGTVQDITERKLISLKLQVSEERLQMAVEATTDGLWDWDLPSGWIYRSAQYYQVTGYSAAEDTHDFEFFKRMLHCDDLSMALSQIDAHRQGKTAGLEFDCRIVTRSGEIRWMCVKGRVVLRNEAGEPLRMVGTLADISQRKSFELAQVEVATVFENSYEGIMVTNAARCITKINPAFTRITGYCEAEILGQTPKLLSSGRHGPQFYEQMWDSLTQHDFWRGEIWNRRKSGEIFAELLSISVVRDATGVIQRYISVFADISQLKAHELELDRIAHYDPLTGSPNRRLLADRLAQSIIRSTRSGKSLAVCFLDLDGFKAINDQYGHATGDQLLIGVTENLKHVLRAEDTQARLGGDEFVLLLSDINSPEECALILERVLSAISSPIQVEDGLLSVSASIGVSLYPDDNADADTLLRHADQAMYLAKESGKNRYHLFDPESDRKAQTHRKYLDLLGSALANAEFVLYYQPKVDLINGEIIGVEALIRWQNPEKGLLAPAEFLPHINGSHLEKTFGEWVINAAVAQAASWYESGLNIVVSANVSASHLLQPDFYADLRKALARYPAFPASHFELEVLETAAIADIEQAVVILQQCRELGVHFALDDFGTGYSSLTYLRRLPVDTLKIDQSFVRDMLNDSDDLGIVEGVIRLAGAFNRQVIAEGVETLAHGAVLLRLGCRLAQGYGIARPMPADQFIDWSLRWKAQGAWLSIQEEAFAAQAQVQEATLPIRSH